MSDYLPPELITQILRRLPVESAVKCTAVCKTWYALVKDPSFISTHLQQAVSSLYNNLLLCFKRDGREVYHSLRDDDTGFEEHKQFCLPFQCRFGFFRAISTCNGLICLAKDANTTWSIILWNPSIYKHFILPNPGLSYTKSYNTTFGFGFDSASNDYKVLLVVHFTSRERVIEVWLFSLNRLSWTMRREVSPNQSMFDHSDAVFVKGILHFPTFFWDPKSEKRNASHMISAFDISTEKFYVMNYPETLANVEYEMSLVPYEESIAVVRRSNGDSYGRQCELWVMKEYGVNSSWAKVLVFDAQLLNVLEVRKKEKVLLQVRGDDEHEHELATWDLNFHQQGHHRRLKRHHAGIRIKSEDSFVGRFVESLVLLDIGEEDIEG